MKILTGLISFFVFFVSTPAMTAEQQTKTTTEVTQEVTKQKEDGTIDATKTEVTQNPEETTDDDKQAVPSEDTAAGTKEDSTAEKEDTQEQQGTRVVGEFGDWTKECEEVPVNDSESVEICQLSQILVDGETDIPTMKMALGYVPGKENPVTVFTLPLGIYLPAGLKMRIDKKGKIGSIPINFCSHNGCQAGVQLDKNIVRRMKKGNIMEVTFVNAMAKPVSLPVSLKGITAGLRNLEKDRDAK